VPISGKKAIKILEENGFSVSRQKGSHVVLVKLSETGKKIVVVPVHKELKKGTLRSIANMSEIDKSKFGL
jgi:predicted RNA binding protein YcfA (HicA-like mRNA interferase family)